MKKKMQLAFSPGCFRFYFLSLFSLLISAGIYAQTVTGTVLDGESKPVSGATVNVKGTTKSTVTNNAGTFSIAAGATDVLIISHVNFVEQEISVGGRSTVSITLSNSVRDIDEVVVTALGIKRQAKALGYSTTSVKTDELVTNRTNNVMEALVGKVAGLNITPPAAGAGASTQIRLRGQVGFAGSNNAPLLVVNGLPLDQGARGADGGQQRDRGDNLLNINPDDIESMQVLKGSTASALYGSRAAAGAIIITTKTGAKGAGIGVEYTSSYTNQQALNFMDEILQTEFGQGQAGVKPATAGIARSTGQFSFGGRLDGSMTPIFDGTMQPYVAHPNRLFDYLQNATNFTNTVALTGGGANGGFRLSVSNTDAKGIEPTNEYKRKTVNLGVNQNITKKLKLTVNINWANEEQINPPQIGQQGAGSVNFFTRLANSIPLSALKNSAVDPATGTEAITSGFQGTLLNPYYHILAGQKWNNKRDRILSTATLRWDVTDWLYLQGRYNYDYSTEVTETVSPGGIGTSVPTNADGTFKGGFNVTQARGTDINAEFLVGATKKAGKFSFMGTFGGNTWRVKDQNTSVGSSNFIVRDLYTLGNGNVKTQGYGYGVDRTNSLFGMAEVGFNDLFYLTLTGRNDWFSVYNPAQNNVFYPSASASFIFTELNAFKNISWLTYGKLRGAWAQTGSKQGVNRYEGLLYYNIPTNNFNGQPTASISGATAPNPFLAPFKVRETEIGLELRLFNRLQLDVAAFDKVTTDQVLNVTLSNTSGYTGSKDNLASLRNRGLETNVEYSIIQNKDFGVSTSWNNTYLATKVLAISPGVNDFLLLNFNATGNEFLGQIRYTVGLPMNQLYTRTYERNAKGEIVVGTNGRLRSPNVYIPVGSSIPKFTGGWTTNFRYKNFNLGVFIDYKFGGKMLSSTHLNLLRQGHSKASLVGRRTGETGVVFPGVSSATGLPNTVAVNPQDFYADYRNLQIGDPFIFKSDFIKLRNISLSYNLTSLVKKAQFLNFVKGLSVSGSVRNVRLFTGIYLVLILRLFSLRGIREPVMKTLHCQLPVIITLV